MLAGRETRRLVTEGHYRDRLAAASESMVQADPDGGATGGGSRRAEQEASAVQHDRPSSHGGDWALMPAVSSGR